MVEALQKGDEVIASGGWRGKISKINESYITLEVAELGDKPVEVVLQRAAVQSLLPRGTLKDSR